MDRLVITEVRGVGDRLLLGGDFTARDIKTLPWLRGLLVDPFGYWSKKNRCSTNPQYYTTATISLGFEDAVDGTPIYKLIVPIRYGIDVEQVAGQAKDVGQVTWRIIDDPAGGHRGLKTRVHWMGNSPAHSRSRSISRRSLVPRSDPFCMQFSRATACGSSIAALAGAEATDDPAGGHLRGSRAHLGMLRVLVAAQHR